MVLFFFFFLIYKDPIIWTQLSMEKKKKTSVATPFQT